MTQNQRPINCDGLEEIPAVFSEASGLREQARSCAIAYNEALRISKNCDVGNYFLRVAEIGGLAGATFSSAVAAFVPNADDAHPTQALLKRQWQEAALVLTGVFAISSGYDLFLNCEKRSADQVQLASEHQTALLNAARFLQCSDPAVLRASAKAEWAVKVSNALVAAPSDTNLWKALGALQKLPGDNAVDLLAAAEVVRLAAKEPAVQPVVEQTAGDAVAASAQLADAINYACDDAIPADNKDAPADARSKARRYRDRAAAELMACTTVRPTPYGSSSGSK